MKDAVNFCIITQGGVTNCDSGTNGVPALYNGPAGSNLGSVGVVDGVITATASNNNGLSGQTAVLTPTLASNNSVTWCLTGSNEAGLSASCDAGSGDGSGGGGSGFSCSVVGGTCTNNGTTYTMWPQAQSDYVVGGIDNFATALSGHSLYALSANFNLWTSGSGDFYIGSSANIGCNGGTSTCRRVNVLNRNGATVGNIYSTPLTDDQTIPVTWQTTLP